MTKTNRRTAGPRNGHTAPHPQCYCMGAGPRLTALMAGAVDSSPVVGHFRTAGIEMLKGFRAILDAQIETLTRRESPRGTKVPVE